MISYRYLWLAAALFSGNICCAENRTSSDEPQTCNESSGADNDASPSLEETIVQIANDPGAAFGGER